MEPKVKFSMFVMWSNGISEVIGVAAESYPRDVVDWQTLLVDIAASSSVDSGAVVRVVSVQPLPFLNDAGEIVYFLPITETDLPLVEAEKVRTAADLSDSD